MNKQEFEEIKTKFAKETFSKKVSKWLNLSSILFAFSGAIMIVMFYFDNIEVTKKENLSSYETLKNQIENLKSELKASENLNIELKKNIKIQETETENKKDNIIFQKLQQDVETLNQVILNSPEKAISIPILKIEMENQKKQNDKEIESIKNDITRVYDMSKWIIGLVFTMLVSIIVLNVSNLFAKTNKKE